MGLKEDVALSGQEAYHRWPLLARMAAARDAVTAHEKESTSPTFARWKRGQLTKINNGTDCHPFQVELVTRAGSDMDDDSSVVVR